MAAREELAIKVRVEKFCSLATSPSWQAWLFHLDHDLYRRFIKRLQGSRGCNQNRELMEEILREVEKVEGGSQKLIDFLEKHYPATLALAESQGVDKQVVERPSQVKMPVFEHYNPNILTYPRRLIMTGTPQELQKKVREFLLDKIQSDFVVIGEVAYIEYLKVEDSPLKNKIPIRNWMVAAWRSRHGVS